VSARVGVRQWLGAHRAALSLAIVAVITVTSSVPVMQGAAAVYNTTVFADGFEAGSLVNWDGAGGTGSATVVAAAAHTGAFGLRFSNAAGQYSFLQKLMTSPVVDSSTSFFVRVNTSVGVQTLAQGRDQTTNVVRWEIFNDASTHGLSVIFYNSTGGSGMVYSGDNSLPLSVWTGITVVYTGTTTGGGQLFLNGTTKPEWAVTGDYSNSAPYQRLQLWNDSSGSADFDDVSISLPTAGPPPAPTGLSATPGTTQVILSWTAVSGATSYNVKRATVSGGPYTTVGSPTTTSFTDTGLTNGTTYYYVVSAVNAGGESANSADRSKPDPGGERARRRPDVEPVLDER
jgi:hypothetical protein